MSTTLSCWEMDEVNAVYWVLAEIHIHRACSVNIFTWGVTLCCHAACKNFAGLFVVRFILGMCEGSITAGFLIVTSMFYTRAEQTKRVGYWCDY